ncbi:MAG: four helix bundle protein [Clostridia bacterium]|nr:four helix bundle protein [Clostridia bacterium]
MRIVKLSDYLAQEKKTYVLAKQVLKSGTSIGANVAEAQHAQSKADFISKMSIALKEAAETDYWLRIMKATSILNEKEADSLRFDCDELYKLLTSIVKTSKGK